MHILNTYEENPQVLIGNNYDKIKEDRIIFLKVI